MGITTPKQRAGTGPENPRPESSRRPVYWVVSTHWDREWYETFQNYRFRLVSMLDEVLEALDRDPHFTHFQMDGQVIPIEDYLEIRPEKANTIRRLAGEGRLALGPWYVMPDEFIVSGESLVRNLQLGRQVAAQYGPPSRAGFICDIFGHNSQLPQIFKGFGIECAFFFRGLNEKRVGANFQWRSPDGTTILVNRLGRRSGYCDFTIKLRDSFTQGAALDVDLGAQRALDYIKEQVDRYPAGTPILLFDGGDHLEIEPVTGAIIERLQQGALDGAFELRMGTLDDYTAALLAGSAAVTKVLDGELREPGAEWAAPADDQWLIASVLSSRIPLKQANARCESLLTQWAEPWSAFTSPAGLEYPAGYLRVAWRNLITNHPHDSICGCSIDQVHKDMEYRFDQVEQIGGRIKRMTLDHLAERVAASHLARPEEPRPDWVLLLANPTARAIDEPVDFDVNLPPGTPCFQEFFGYEAKPGFHLADASGRELPYQRISQTMNVAGFARERRKFPTDGTRHRIGVTARVHIPAFGYTSVGVRPTKPPEGSPAFPEPTRHGGTPLRTGARTAENEFFTMEITGGGLLNLTDKRTGQTYAGLLELEDCADIGDGWNHGVAVNDEVFLSGAAAASVACIADGPAKTTFRVELEWPLPARFDFATMRRSGERTRLRAEHEITLRAGTPRVEVKTTIHNTVEDHRLRALFPTGAPATHYLADSPYDVVRRPIALSPERFNWRELEVETKPQQSWTAVHAGGRGLAIVSHGLPESAAQDLPGRPIALTLFRAFRKTVMTNGEPGGQIQGTLTFNAWIVPLASEPDHAELCWLGQRLAAGVGQATARVHEGTPNQPITKETAPAELSFLEVAGPVTVTAIRRTPEGQLIVRLFNPQHASVRCKIRQPGITMNAAWRCNLNEEPEEPLPVKADTVNLTLPTRRIITVRLD